MVSPCTKPARWAFTPFRRITVTTALTVTAIGTVLAFPDMTSAEPSAEEKYDKVKDEYSETADELADLKKDLKSIKNRLGDAERDIEQTGDLLAEVPSTIDQDGSVMGRLGDLSEYGAIQNSELRDALERQEDALADRKSVKRQISKKEDNLDDLRDKKEKLADKLESAEDSGDSSGSSGSDEPASVNANEVVAFAQNQLGEPYVFGAAGPDSWDCSGLTMAAWATKGVSLSHGSRDQYAQTQRVADPKPGDLVFYNSLGHVGIYIGDGEVIHAPTAGQNVQVSAVDMMPIEGYGRP